MDQERQRRLDEVARIAAKLETETGVPARLIVAQWAIESKWGERHAGNANYFGMKRASRHLKFCEITTHEAFTPEQLEAWKRRHPGKPVKIIRVLPDGRLWVELSDEFADYDSLEESCRDYTWLIKNGDPYREAWAAFEQDRDTDKLIREVAVIYATNPRYAELIGKIAMQGNVSEAIGRGSVVA